MNGDADYFYEMRPGGGLRVRASIRAYIDHVGSAARPWSVYVSWPTMTEPRLVASTRRSRDAYAIAQRERILIDPDQYVGVWRWGSWGVILREVLPPLDREDLTADGMELVRGDDGEPVAAIEPVGRGWFVYARTAVAGEFKMPNRMRDAVYSSRDDAVRAARRLANSDHE